MRMRSQLEAGSLIKQQTSDKQTIENQGARARARARITYKTEKKRNREQ